MKNAAKKVSAVLLTAVLLLVVASAAAFVRLDIRTKALHDDIDSVMNDKNYRTAVGAEEVKVITQQVSCGYAVIEMFSRYSGGEITEQKLYDTYGKVVTSTGSAFCDEMNRQFDGFDTAMYRYLPDSELLKKVHESLEAGVPVPFEWAAKTDDEWTLHYSLITGMDLFQNRITVANPYGYTENITAEELLERTSFEAYEDMPLLLRFGFAFGIFEKNTVFIPVRK